MDESGVDMSYDLESGDSSSYDPTIVLVNTATAATASGTRIPNLLKRKQMRFQNKLLLLKQKQEQDERRLATESPRASPRAYRKMSSSSLKSLTFPQFVDTATGHIMDGRTMVTNSLKCQATEASQSRPRFIVGDSAVYVSNSLSLTSASEPPMKFNLRPMSSSDIGYMDNASPGGSVGPESLGLSSNATSMSEISEQNDEFSFANIVEVKELDRMTLEQQEDLSEIFDHASLSDGFSGLLNDKREKAKLELSISCPAELVEMPAGTTRYRGGRKKEGPPPNMTAEQRIQWEKDRQKKDNHNCIERRRRDKINECIKELAVLLSKGDDPDSNDYFEKGKAIRQQELASKKGSILEASVNFIRQAKIENRNIEEFKKRRSELETINRILQMQVQQLSLTINQMKQTSHLTESLPVQQYQQMQQLTGQHLPQVIEMQLAPNQQFQQPNKIQVLDNHQHQECADVHLDDQFMTQVDLGLPSDEKFPDGTQQVYHLVPNQTSEYHLVTNNNSQFDTLQDNMSLFLDLNDDSLTSLQQGFNSLHPEQAMAMDFDEFSSEPQFHLINDPLLSNTSDSAPADLDDEFLSSLMPI